MPGDGVGEQYECSLCHGIFTKTVPDQEALAEMEALFLETSDPEIVCDGCWRRVMAWAEAQPDVLR